MKHEVYLYLYKLLIESPVGIPVALHWLHNGKGQAVNRASCREMFPSA